MYFTTRFKMGWGRDKKNIMAEKSRGEQFPHGQLIPKSKHGEVWVPSAQLLYPHSLKRDIPPPPLGRGKKEEVSKQMWFPVPSVEENERSEEKVSSLPALSSLHCKYTCFQTLSVKVLNIATGIKST